MIFVETAIRGAFRIEPEPIADERGFFARTFCAEEFRAKGLDERLVQCSVSYNLRRGTLRGMHYQAAPYEETKLVRCTRGAIFDVLVDLRPDAETFRRWVGGELSAENRHLHYVPAGIAHGFLTLTDACEVFYQMSVPYRAEAARGVRWNDPAFGIDWPAPVEVISERDRTFGDFAGAS